MPRRKFMTTVYMTQEQRSALVRLSAETRIPQSTFIREGIDLVLAKHANVLAAIEVEEAAVAEGD